MDKWESLAGENIRVFVGCPADGRVLQATVPNVRSIVQAVLDSMRKAFGVSLLDITYCTYDADGFIGSCERDFEGFMAYVRKVEGIPTPG